MWSAWPERSMRPGRALIWSLLRQRAAAVLRGREGLVARDRREVLVVVPRPLRFRRLLDLEQVHVVHHAPVLEHLALLGEEVLDRHLVQLLRHRLGLVGAGGLDRLEVL